MNRLFFELLQVAIEKRRHLSCVPTPEEWQLLLRISQKQSLTGIIFYAVQKLPQEQWPTRDVVLQWMTIAQYIEQRNQLVTQVCLELIQQYTKDGFECCILKGQANHQYYGSKQLANLRICGDIDVWIVPKDSMRKNSVAKVLRYLENTCGIKSLCYLHAEVKPIRGVPVEVHLRPSFMNSPVSNRRFLRLFKFEECVCQKEIDGVVLPVLKVDYDVVFQLNHLYRHLIDEGIGLRQVTDFYMLLQGWHNEKKMTKEEIMRQVRLLGMERFAHALMYVMQEVFDLSPEYYICEPSENDGRFLLHEIMLAGNFGQDDPRMPILIVRKGKLSYQISRAKRRFTRNLRFLSSYPEEVICEPFARLTHLWWRKFKLWKL